MLGRRGKEMYLKDHGHLGFSSRYFEDYYFYILDWILTETGSGCSSSETG